MAHYSQSASKWNSQNDGLIGNGTEVLPVISQPGSPIAANDLAVLVALIGPIGLPVIILLCAIWITILLSSIRHLISRPDEHCTLHYIHRGAIIRVLAAGVLVFSSVYLLLSLVGYAPFTGRLIYGLGVDSVTGPLETIMLLTLIGLKFHHSSSKLNSQ